MARLIVGLVLFAAVVMAVSAILRLVSSVAALPGRCRDTTGTGTAKEDVMPAILRNLSYGLLLALMVGISTGWLGGL
ncbi:MAG: hypothetical protein IT542_13740 [Rubellimicrobium sp.]|nr:hypothetical protein [Rubellimicrobium sp.]